MTVNGNLLVVHRSPSDGPPDEVVFECPAGFDPAIAGAEAQRGVFHIELPQLRDPKYSNLAEKEIARKNLENWLAQESKAAASHMNEIEQSPWGRFSQN